MAGPRGTLPSGHVLSEARDTPMGGRVGHHLVVAMICAGEVDGKREEMRRMMVQR